MRVLDCFFHVSHDGFFVVSDDHGTPAQHVRGPHHHGISHLLCALGGFFQRCRHHTGRLRNLQFFQQLVEVLAIFG